MPETQVETQVTPSENTNLGSGASQEEGHAQETPQASIQPGETTERPQETSAPTEPKSRTYSEEDFARFKSEKDRAIAERDRQLAALAMQQQIAQAQAEEARAVAEDKAEVEQGIITEQDAKQRRDLRAKHKAIEARITSLTRTEQEMAARAETLGYALAAHDIAEKMAKEEGLTDSERLKLFNELATGEKSKSPEEMMARAERAMRLRAKAAAKPKEKFDKGSGGTVDQGADTEAQRLKARYPTMYKQ